jgi:glycerophosphoryl diester phosphodiesterase
LPTRLVRDLSFAQLQALDCGVLPNPRFPRQRPVPGQRIPRLEQVLDLLERHPRLGANIEIKTSAERPELTRDPAEFARILVSQVQRRGLERRIVVQSFDPRALRAVKRLEGGIELSALADRREEFAPMLRSTGARILSPRHTELRREDVKTLHRRGVRVMPWTVNAPPRMRELLAWGVDGIITDRPDLLLEILGRSGSISAR